MSQYGLEIVVSGKFSFQERDSGFQNLPATGEPVEILPRDRNRLEVHMHNVGTGDVRISASRDRLKVATSPTVWIIPAGASWHPEFPPQNAVYAMADAGHDLRLYETFIEPYVRKSA